MSSASAAEPRVEEMAVVHRVFRRGFPMSSALVRRTPPGASGRAEAIASHLDFLLNGVHHHHAGEDERIWPLLLQRADVQAALVDRMQTQHAMVSERSDRVRSLLDGWRTSAADSEPLAQAIDELTAALDEHLDEEEASVLPLIRSHISAEEWERMGQEIFERFTNQEKLWATGTLEDVATAEEASWFIGDLPLPIKVMWSLHGRRRYRRYIARVRGTARPGPVQRRLFRAGNRVATALYRRSNGKVPGTAKGLPVLLLTVPGRRTGVAHTVPVVYIEHEGAYLVVGSAGGAKDEPQWFRNLRCAHVARIRIGSGSHDVDVLVPDAAQRDRLWEDIVDREPFFAKYQDKAGRIIPLAVLTITSP